MQILKTLDNIPRLVFWRLDEVAITLVPFTLGILFGNLFLIFGAFIAKILYTRIRKRYADINLKGFVYWNLGTGFKRLPPSYVRKFRR